MKLFFDTNVWVSAVAGSSLCGDLIADCLEHHTVLSSELVKMESIGVITRKLRLTPTELNNAKALLGFSELVADAPDPADDNDARLVAAASAAGADLFVTGHKRVLEWKQSGAMRIVTPRDAWIILFAPHLKH